MNLVRAKITACRLAKLALQPFASAGWAIVVLYQNIDLAQQKIEREAGLDRAWNEWRERQTRRPG